MTLTSKVITFSTHGWHMFLKKRNHDKYATKFRGEHEGVTNATNIFIAKEQQMPWISFPWVAEMMS